jgi:hypothetical protein
VKQTVGEFAVSKSRAEGLVCKFQLPRSSIDDEWLTFGQRAVRSASSQFELPSWFFQKISRSRCCLECWQAFNVGISNGITWRGGNCFPGTAGGGLSVGKRNWKHQRNCIRAYQKRKARGLFSKEIPAKRHPGKSFLSGRLTTSDKFQISGIPENECINLSETTILAEMSKAFLGHN